MLSLATKGLFCFVQTWDNSVCAQTMHAHFEAPVSGSHTQHTSQHPAPRQP